MLTYPSIPRVKESKGLNQSCIAFNKYDGSNLRWEWSPKKQWHKYGSRTQLFDASHPIFGSSIEEFKDLMGAEIVRLVLDAYGKKTERIVAFTEFWGANSFAGQHQPEDTKFLTLFDVSVYKKGFMPAEQFVQLFSNLYGWAASVVYTGPMSHEFIEAIRHGVYKVNEGVICKGDDWSAKIKTYEYLNKLKHRYGDEWEKYGE